MIEFKTAISLAELHSKGENKQSKEASNAKGKESGSGPKPWMRSSTSEVSSQELVGNLGVPLVHGKLKATHFAHLQTKVVLKLSGWKTKFLSLAGLVNYSLMPMMYCSLQRPS